MEHYKSTLATAAVAAFGLVAAAHILHPGNYEAVPRYTKAPIVSVEAPVGTTAWANPPVRVGRLPTSSDAIAPSAQAAEARPALALEPIASAAAAFQPEVQPVQASAKRLRKPKAGRRHRVAQRQLRTQQASLNRSTSRTAAADEQGAAPGAAPRAADRFDPIGNLIHGLGLDS